MNISVRFYGHLGDLIGKKSKIEFDLKDNATFSCLLDELLKDPKIKLHLLDESGELKSDITFMKNGREIKFLQGLETVLESGDEISIFPLVAGG
ncbi:MAG: ubiquitin-like small modifier protein 1 [Candidatus Thorarchaeota archaeon]